jgi:hypothetical protein
MTTFNSTDLNDRAEVIALNRVHLCLDCEADINYAKVINGVKYCSLCGSDNIIQTVYIYGEDKTDEKKNLTANDANDANKKDKGTDFETVDIPKEFFTDEKPDSLPDIAHLIDTGDQNCHYSGSDTTESEPIYPNKDITCPLTGNFCTSCHGDCEECPVYAIHNQLAIYIRCHNCLDYPNCIAFIKIYREKQ